MPLATGQTALSLTRRLANWRASWSYCYGLTRNAPYIVYHDAYSHFERRFGLTNQGAVTSDEERRPGASHIRHIRATIAASGARCIFLEPQFEPQILAAITEDRDIRVGELDPLGVDLVPGVNGFFHLMRNLARGFANCLSQP
jgi:zinc transport system substrate-binding protein